MKLRYLLIASGVCLVAGIFSIGQNVAGAQQLAANVVAQDSAGQSTTASLKTLSNYVGTHMGASQTVFLETSYTKAQATSSVAPETSGQVYHDAQTACVSHTTAVNQADCVQSYLASHATPGSSTAITQPAAVNKTPYTYSYQSPRWTPDLAGILLLMGLLGLAGTGVIAVARRLKP